MYGQVSAAGVAAGVPAVLAATGMSSSGFAVAVGAGVVSIAVGVILLRRAYRPA